MKKVVSVALCGSLLASVLSGCSQDAKAQGDFSITRTGYTDVRPASKDLWMWKEYEKETGKSVAWEEIPGGSLQERKNVILAGKELPDAFYQVGFSFDELAKYGQQGMFVPLEGLIKEHAPNIQQMLDENPDIKASITMPDGHIYSLPYVDYDPVYRSIRYYINKTWLDNLGLPVPTTTEEFYSTMKAFKEKDPNKNGIADEEGWYMPSGTVGWTLERQLMGSFGMSEGGGAALGSYLYVDTENNNELKLTVTDEKYRDVLRYEKKLFSEGLIQQQSYGGVDYNLWVADGAKDKVGAFSWGDANYIGEKAGEHFVGISVLEGPKCDKGVSWIDPATRGNCAFVMTKAAKDPEGLIKWVDGLYGKKGTELTYFGKEGDTFHMKDGKKVYDDKILNHKDGAQLGAFQFVDNVYGGYAPYIEPSAEEKANAVGKTLEEVLRTDTKSLTDNLPKNILPNFPPTLEESKAQDAILTDINNYIGEMRTKFVTGKADLDKDWDAYKAKLDQMGIQKYLEIKKTQYDRYLKNTK